MTCHDVKAALLLAFTNARPLAVGRFSLQPSRATPEGRRSQVFGRSEQDRASLHGLNQARLRVSVPSNRKGTFIIRIFAVAVIALGFAAAPAAAQTIIPLGSLDLAGATRDNNGVINFDNYGGTATTTTLPSFLIPAKITLSKSRALTAPAPVACFRRPTRHKMPRS